MKPDEADAIIAFLFGAFNRKPTEPQQQAWRGVLLELDAQVCMSISMVFQRTVTHVPSAHEFLMAYRSELDRGRPGQMRRVKCEVCLDDGQVFVGTNAMGTDMTAPCPQCDKGRALAFQWYGNSGYWQGRQWKRGEDAEGNLIPQTVELLAA